MLLNQHCTVLDWHHTTLFCVVTCQFVIIMLLPYYLSLIHINLQSIMLAMVLYSVGIAANERASRLIIVSPLSIHSASTEKQYKCNTDIVFFFCLRAKFGWLSPFTEPPLTSLTARGGFLTVNDVHYVIKLASHSRRLFLHLWVCGWKGKGSCKFVCVCLCESERERNRERESACVCVHGSECGITVSVCDCIYCVGGWHV